MKYIAFVVFLLLSVNGGSQTYDDFKKAKQAHDSTAVDTAIMEERAATTYNPYQVAEWKFAMEQNRKIYDWQDLSGKIIFFVVILIVLTGLYLSYKQFLLGEKMLTEKRAVQTVEKGDATVEVMNASLEVSKEGVKINTAVIGLVILIISLSFLFLYLNYVYPISIVKMKS